MQGHSSRRILPGLCAAGLVLFATAVWACSVPVFRYALERWSSDTYEVFIFYRGELSETDKAVVESLGQNGLAGGKSANVRAHAFNVDELDPQQDADVLALWKAKKTETLPWMVVHYPLNSLTGGVIWSGPPSDKAVNLLIDSPVRQKIASRILKGETSVWVFLDGGNQQQDDEALKVLEEQLRHAEKTLKLPEIDQQDVDQGLVSIDPQQLRIKFSTIRLQRNDPQEMMFIQMLLKSEPDLLDAEFADKPMAFPLFGRGRVLYALVGKGISDMPIQEACAFLIGPCTCQVKAEHQDGVDMLMAVDWEDLIEPTYQKDQDLPPLSGLGSFVVNTSETDDDPNETDSGGAVETAATDQDKYSGNETALATQAGPERPLVATTTTNATTTTTLFSTVHVSTIVVLVLGVLTVIGGTVMLVRRQG